MNYTYLHYQTALSLLHGIGPQKARLLIQELGSLVPLFESTPSKLEKLTRMNAKNFKKIKKRDALNAAVSAVKFHERHEIQTLFYKDVLFPRRLNNCSDAPTALFVKGSVDLNSAKYVAIVGTRDATPYGKDICRRLIEGFVGKDIVVVSGLAIGIDSYVHEYCVELGVPTVAVLGHGLDRIYPTKNRKLAKKIIENGALITEFLPGTNPDRENFPKRNRIVAGMCDATIVVESKISGGSLITAHLAFGYDRDVFAFPGSINQETSQGCNALISESKARCIQSSQEFLEWMQWDMGEQHTAAQKTFFPDLTTMQMDIVQFIRDHSAPHVDVISARLNIPISQLNPELFHLQISGIVVERPGKQYALL